MSDRDAKATEDAQPVTEAVAAEAAPDADVTEGTGNSESAGNSEDAATDADGAAEDEKPGEAEKAGEAESADGQSGQDSARRGRRVPARRWIAAAVLALGLIAAGGEGWLLFAHHQRTQAAAQALDAAEKYALVLTGVDPNAIDKNFADVLDGATGEFKNMYAASSEQLRALLIENKAAAHGTVVDSAVKSATKNQVEVLLFIDQAVSNKTDPKVKFDRSSIVMTMEKVNGRWLAAKVEMP